MTTPEHDPSPDPAEKRALVLLNAVHGLGPARIATLKQAFGSYAGAAAAPEIRLAGLPGFGPATTRSLVDGRDRFDPETEMARAKDLGMRVVTVLDDEYPEQLRQIAAAPLVLYVRGESLRTLHPAVAVVGTRHCTAYGTDRAVRLASGLARRGVAVVSGLARGIDTAAHNAVLDERGVTAAVLGSGLDKVYPPENRDLVDRIADRGAAMSEFPLGTLPHPSNFPRRNRIISGLSLGVVVVEADLKSGSLITARLAAEQNREVFAVPGRAGQVRSRGPHALIREGAKLVETVGDIVEEIETHLARPPGLEKRDVLQPGGADPLLEVLGQEPLGLDEIVERTGLETSAAAGKLAVLELQGRIRRHPGGRFTAT